MALQCKHHKVGECINVVLDYSFRPVLECIIILQNNIYKHII